MRTTIFYIKLYSITIILESKYNENKIKQNSTT